jgi:hypothetical protein
MKRIVDRLLEQCTSDQQCHGQIGIGIAFAIGNCSLRENR